MVKPSPQLRSEIGEEFESGIDVQRYLQLFAGLAPLMGSRDAEEIGLRACGLIAELLDVEACSIMLADAGGKELRLAAATHIPREEWGRIRLPAREGI